MNLANKITFARILATPIFLFFLMPGWFGRFLGLDQWGRYAAAAVFLLAAITDMVDGKIARKHNMVTELGKFLDPIADKLLVISALIAFVRTDGLSVWAVFIIIAREFIITGFRVIAAGRGVVIAADKWGKVKTIVQIIAIEAILIRDFPLSLITRFPVGMTFMYMAVILSIISGVNYIVKNVNVIR
ncbi:MAG TPA: CDP-diacylglycerol--glycerol-3-phosphate 3-phosphatidyltransferase [Clostridiaceae bacterium]|nr:CDP-diacylglycerol--glycerol-3-phosphate 3-phosphatidyltransferase [Clostridiaceae bacterium]